MFKSFALLLSLLLTVTLAQSFTPSPSQEFAFARAGSKLYIQGGHQIVNNVAVATWNQLFSLDLSTNWSVSSPPWQSLAPGLSTYFIHAVASPDNRTFSVFQQGNNGLVSITNYDIPTNIWNPNPIQVTPDQDYRSGVMPVTDPTSGLVYLNAWMNMDVYNSQSATFQVHPNPANMPQSLFFGGACYIKPRGSIFYFGGLNSSINFDSSASITKEYNIATGAWSNFTTTGQVPPPRSDFCMTASEDGNTVVVYGGRVSAPQNFTSTLYTLDVRTGQWTQGPDGAVRLYGACIVVGTQFVAWGGFDGNSTHTGPPVVFDLTSRQWINNYTAPAYYLNAPTSSLSSSAPTPTSNPSSSSSAASKTSSSPSNLGAIIGGVVGGLFVIALSVIIFIFLKKRDAKVQYSDVKTSEKSSGDDHRQSQSANLGAMFNEAQSERSSGRDPQGLSIGAYRGSTPHIDSEHQFNAHHYDGGFSSQSDSPVVYGALPYAGSEAGSGAFPHQDSRVFGSSAAAYPNVSSAHYDYSIPNSNAALNHSYHAVPGVTLAPAMIDTTTGQVYIVSTPPVIPPVTAAPNIVGSSSAYNPSIPVSSGNYGNMLPQSPQGQRLPTVPQRPVQNNNMYYSSVVTEVPSGHY
ncbi:hypothetical protein BGZ46_006448 [Entomortierella lignicola]|nr:hypothetical protein BGZ46_006448 [Entomortierella lignicola]